MPAGRRPPAKTFVMALLYMPEPLPLHDVDLWVRRDGKPQSQRALGTLRSLHMVHISPAGRERPQEVQLTTNFRSSLRLALEGGGSHNSFGVPSALPVDPALDVVFLDRYARRKWEDILQYVVYSVGAVFADHGAGSSDKGGGPKASVKELLLAGRLVERRLDVKIGMGITQAGFTFLLQEANAQVWTLLLLWLDAADRSKQAGGAMDSVDMLSFLFMLASLELGRAYDTDALTESRRNMLPSLVDFGLVYIPKDTPRQYFPTRLATTLTSSATALRSMSAGFSASASLAPGDAGSVGVAPGAESHKGSIIVETNQRLYAYTASPLQIAVINLFATLDMRFSAMVSGRISRESIRKAIKHGITAEQIVSYLQAHAHEQMARQALATGRPLLPPTVVDQIRLWQLENERMATTAGFLFKDMADAHEYRELSNYADEIGVLVWKSDEKRVFFASKMEQLRDWLKARKK